MTVASNLGFPRIGRRRELKRALERHWAGELDAAALLAEAAALRERHWRLQQGAAISHIPSADFALYDHVLDHSCMFGAIPEGYGWAGGAVSPDTMFALARGTKGGAGAGMPALEMTKWFDTNYHYLVPRLSAAQRFELTANRPLAAFQEAMAQGVRTRPVLLGPVTFLLLSKGIDGAATLGLLDALLPLYAEILRSLAEAGCAWVQIDEPCLALDLPEAARAALAHAYGVLARGPAPDVLLASYFGPIGDNLTAALRLPVAGLHLDLVRGRADLPAVLAQAPREMWLSLGLVDGRNVWRTDLAAALGLARQVADRRGDTRRLMVAPSCSLLHVPVDLAQEDALDHGGARLARFRGAEACRGVGDRARAG